MGCCCSSSCLTAHPRLGSNIFRATESDVCMCLLESHTRVTVTHQCYRLIVFAVSVHMLALFDVRYYKFHCKQRSGSTLCVTSQTNQALTKKGQAL